MKQFQFTEGIYHPDPVKVARTTNAMASVYKGAGGAFEVLVRAYEQTQSGGTRHILSDEEKLKLLEVKFPKENAYDTTIEVNELPPSTLFDLKVPEEDLMITVAKAAQGKSQGPSGLGNSHMHSLANKVQHFIPAVAAFFQHLLENPSLVAKYPAFFMFRIAWIPKKDGGFRPISVHEPFLIAVHRVLV